MKSLNRVCEKVQPFHILFVFIVLKLFWQLGTGEYGYFRDELYMFALSDHPSLGNVDVPPLTPLVLAAVRALFGSSLFVIHLIPALLGCVLLFILYKMVRTLGGGIFALILALSCGMWAPQYIGGNSIYTYDSFDMVIWASALYAILLFLKTDNRRYLILFGIAAGVGLLTKITVLFLGFAFVFSLLLTKHRRVFISKHLYIAGICALAAASPYIIWQVLNGFPTIAFFSNYASCKTYDATVLDYFKNQMYVMIQLCLLCGVIH